MWEKISGLISIVVIVNVCVLKCAGATVYVHGRVFVCLTVHERVIVTVLYPICGGSHLISKCSLS